jgi:hypothetical protein
MKTDSAAPPRETTAWEIRRRAFYGSVGAGGVGAVIAIYYGHSIQTAAISGLAVGLVTLITWIVYHFTSGQNNGLVILSVGFQMSFASCRETPTEHSLIWVPILSLIFWIPMAWFMGRWAWAQRKSEVRKLAQTPMFDAQVDAISPTSPLLEDSDARK